MNDTSTIGFAGLSHLGIVYSAAATAKGFSVAAFDPQPELVKDLVTGHLPILESGLEELVRQNRALIRYTADPEALGSCALIFIALDVRTDDNNNSSLEPLEALIKEIAAHASPDATLVIMSQVPPGFCRNVLKNLPANVHLFYQVETLVFGNALDRAVHPERYIVGCADPDTSLPDLYRHFLSVFECPVLQMGYESAELCKIAINCFLVSSVCTANTLAEICEKIGANWGDIVPALRSDRRIGSHAYLNPGLGIAGGNLERDLVTVQKLAAEYGCDTRVVTAWQQNSAYAKDWVLRRLHRLGLLQEAAGAAFAVWGLAYKPDTNSNKNSAALSLFRALPKCQWRVHDPVVRIDTADFPSVRQCASPLEAIDAVKALIVMTPWNEFRQISSKEIRSRLGDAPVIDPFGLLDGTLPYGGHAYHRMGR
ncbi:MAG TPA: nucleotide sugar dehydrogenase [Terriglobia bacterium]|nr:nucleotide sugar dehydrogenase [Terriglobia bacterium]